MRKHNVILLGHLVLVFFLVVCVPVLCTLLHYTLKYTYIHIHIDR